MDAHKVKVSVRQERGKGPARRLRGQGLIPAVLYGAGADAISLTADPHELIKALDPGKKRNTVFELEIDGHSEKDPVYAMIRDFQEDTLKGSLLHVDFVRVSEDRPVEVTVPVYFTGKAKGVQMGGMAHQVFREVPIRCTPDRIPVHLEHDVTSLEIGEMLSVSDLDPGEGVEVLLPSEQTLFSIMAGRVAGPLEGGEETSEEAEAEAPAAG